MNRKMELFVIIGLLVLLSIATMNMINICIAEARTENPFETAVPIEPGTYSGKCGSGQADSYTIQGKAGHELVVEVTVKSSDDYWKIVLYNDDREKLTYCQYTSPSPKALSWLSHLDRTYYIVIQNSEWANDDISYSLTVSSIPRYDANSGRDAGDTTETAVRVTAGKYQGFVAEDTKSIYKYSGDDENDLYVVHLEKDQTLNVKITPEIDCEVVLYLFDQDMREIDKDKPENKGAIVRGSWKATSSQDVYILATSDPWKWGGISEIYAHHPGPYTLEVDIEGEEPTDTPSKPTPTVTITQKALPTPTSAKTSEEEKNDIPGFEAIFTIAGLLAVVCLFRWRR